MRPPTILKPLAPLGPIEFELIAIDQAREAHDALPPGVDLLPTLIPDYWEQRRRKPGPRDRALTGETIGWVLALPPDLRPSHLCDHYPRAANAIAAAWNGPQRLDVLDDLLVDKRGQRRGFPPEVQRELMALNQWAASDAPLGDAPAFGVPAGDPGTDNGA